MKFNTSKCFIMNIHNTKLTSNHIYHMGGTPLETVPSNPYLGVEFNNHLDWSPHIHNITARAHCLLGFLRRNLRKCPQSLRSKAYLSIVRPVVEYSSTVWSPHQIGLKTEIEMVQRKAARMVLNQPHRRDQRDSVSDMISSLGWESLESRRIKADLTMLYKTTNNLIKIPQQYHPIPTTRSTRSNHEHKLQHIQAATNTYKFSLYPRTVPIWNDQPAELIEQDSLEGFKGVLNTMTF